MCCIRGKETFHLPRGWSQSSRSNIQCVTYTEVIYDIFCYEIQLTGAGWLFVVYFSQEITSTWS